MTPADQKNLLDDVEAFCQEIRPTEELCYVEYRFNDQVLPLARQFNLLGRPVPAESFSPQAKVVMPASYAAMSSVRDCAVRAENLLGEQGNGFKIAMGTLVSGGLSAASGRRGVIEDCLAEVGRYTAQERSQHGKR